jgi:hypothetical protein
MKYRTDYHKNTKVIRITNGQYGLLRELGNNLGVSLAEALQVALEAQKTKTPEQIPMFEAKAHAVIIHNGHLPVTTITSKPVTYYSQPRTELKVKTRGVVVDGHQNGKQG